MAQGMGRVLYQQRGGYFIAYRIPGSRKLIKEYFGHDRDAERKATARLHEVAMTKAKGETLRGTSHVYLDQLAAQYMQDAKVRGAGERWGKEFWNLLNTQILPHLCRKPVDQLEYADVLALVGPGMPWAGKSTPTVNRYLGYLRAVFRFGVAHGLTTKNPLAKWKKTPERKKDVHLWEQDVAGSNPVAPTNKDQGLTP